MALIDVYITTLNRDVLKKKKPGDTINFTTTTPPGLKVEVTVHDIHKNSIVGTTPYATSGNVRCILLVGANGHTTVVLND